jgi:hypothetical protein
MFFYKVHSILFFLLLLGLKIVSAQQNVGIGTTNPTNKLTVVGNGSYMSNAMTFSSNRVSSGVLFIENSDGNQQTLRLDGSNIQSTYADPQVFPPRHIPRPMVLNPYGGNVGIGTNFSPVYKLHLWSNSDELMKIDGNNSLVSFNDNTSNSQYGFIRAWTRTPNNPAGYYGLELGVPPTNFGEGTKRLMLSTNYNLRIIIMEDGNVGVNTAAPNSKLQVNGSLSMPIRTVVADGNSSITDEDFTIIADMGNSASKIMNLILPSANGRKGRIYNIMGINVPVSDPGASTGVIKIFSNTFNLLTQFYENSVARFTSPLYTKVDYQNSCTLQSDGVNWYIISSNAFSETTPN